MILNQIEVYRIYAFILKSGLKDSQFYCPFTINVGDGQIEIEAAEQGETFLDYDKRFWD
ncbi:MAG: hypothetical protein MJA30_10050 [Cytophagales bacterium]|nr:hypothetical protein [Cytophagales bacterium]